MFKKSVAVVFTMAVGAVLVLGAACSDSDDESADQAEDLAGSYQDLSASLALITDIGAAEGDDKDSLKDNCSDLQDGIDSDPLDDFCDDLGEAVDDEDQAKFDAVKAQFAAVEPEIRAGIAGEIGDVINDDDDDGIDNPLDGDGTSEADVDVDNPLDDDGDGDNDDGVDNPIGSEDNNE